MATKRVLADGTIKWRARVRDYSELVDGKPRWRTETYDTEQEATFREMQMTRDKKAGRAISPSLTEQEVTFGDLAGRWLDAMSSDWAKKTERLNRDIVTKHLKPVIGNAVVSKINAERLRKAKNDLAAAGTSEGMINRSINVASRVLDYAIGEGIVSVNAADVLRKRGGRSTAKPSKSRTIRPMVPAEIEAARTAALAQTTAHALRNATMISVMGYAGLRPAELRGLRWSDWTDGKLHIRRAVADGEVIGTKTKQSARAVGVWLPLADDLTEWRAAAKYNGADDYVFPREDGEPMTTIDAQNWTVRIWNKVAPADSVPYDARHGHASLLYRMKWDEGRIAYRMGHTVSTLHEFYVHPMAQFAEDEEVNALDLIAAARGVDNPKMPKPVPDDEVTDEVTGRMRSLSDEDRAAVLRFLDERQWDRMAAETVTRVG